MMPVLCIGAVLWDVIGRAPGRMAPGADVPGRIRHIPGGVALNVAMVLARMGQRPALLGAVGHDAEGEALVGASAAMGVETGFLTRNRGLATDVYMAIEDSNGLIAAIADAHSLEAAGESILAPLRDGRLGAAARPFAGAVVLDGNLTEALLAAIAADPCFARADLRLVPASPGKAARLRPLLSAPNACFYVNRIEAEILTGRPHADAATAAQALVALGARRAIVTDGAAAVADACAGAVFTALPPPVTIARVTGAGDTLLAAHITAERSGIARPAALERAVAAAAAHVSGKDVS